MIRKDLKGKKVSITLKNSDGTFETKVREIDGVGIWIDTADYPGTINEYPGGQVLIKYENLSSVSIISPLPGVPDLP
jgi:hypothetical protein